MTRLDRWTGAVAAAALLLCAPRPGEAQRIGVAPAVQYTAADPLDDYVAESTGALLRQVRVLTEPGGDLGDEAVRAPCDSLVAEPELDVARARPDALFAAAAWLVASEWTIRTLRRPLGVCFPGNRDVLDRANRNVILFNSQWIGRHGGSWMLCGYAHPRERTRALGGARAAVVQRGSSANLSGNLVPLNAGPSADAGKGRWVQYHPRPRAAPGTAACP